MVQEKQEQLDLIDTQPENAKEILRAAKSYKKFQAMRLATLENEVQEKQKVLMLVKEANLQHLPDGTIRFKLDGVRICIKPRDELITVKCDEED